MAESTFFTGPLRTKMSEDLQMTGTGKRTHDGYLREIRKLADHRRMPPDQITEQQVRTYFLHLKNERKFAACRNGAVFSAAVCASRTPRTSARVAL